MNVAVRTPLLTNLNFGEYPFHALRCISLPERCAGLLSVACFEVLVARDTCKEKAGAP